MNKHSITYDIIWHTCRYSGFLDSDYVYRALEKKMVAVCKSRGWELKRFGQDYGCVLQVQVSVPPEVSASFAASTLKRLTAKVVRSNSKVASKLPSVWTREFYAQSVGPSFIAPTERFNPMLDMANAIERMGASIKLKEKW